MKYLPFILALLSSCSIDQKCHRLERKIVNNAKYCQLVLRDTVTVKDTVFIGTVSKDSTFIMNHDIDTFYINRERLHVQIVTHDSLIYVKGQCDSIIKYVTKTVYRDKLHVSPFMVWLREVWHGFKRWLILVILILIGALVWKHRGKVYAVAKKIPFIRNWLP